MKKTNGKKGFTLVELVIVIAVIAILSAILVPTFSTVISNANETKAQSAILAAIKDYIAEEADEADGATNIEALDGDYFTYADSTTVYLYSNGTLTKSTETITSADGATATLTAVNFSDGNAPTSGTADFGGIGNNIKRWSKS